jgi:hypothetical protein
VTVLFDLKSEGSVENMPFYQTGLIPAAPVSHGYKNFWLRDGWYVGICSEEYVRNRIWNGMISIAERYEWKLRYHNVFKPNLWYEYMHVRYSPSGEEIAEGWLHTQWDGIANWLEVCLDKKRYDLAELIAGYMGCVGVHKSPAATVWEDGDFHDPYTLAACAHALYRAKDHLHSQRNMIEEMAEHSVCRMRSLLPFVHDTRPVCLSQLGIIWPFDLAGSHRDEILYLTQKHLMREPFGFIRYEGDKYDGEGFSRGRGTETPWLLGDLYMAMIEPNNPKWRKRLEMAYRHFSCMPEAYFPETMKANRNTPLLWAEAMFNRVRRSWK